MSVIGLYLFQLTPKFIDLSPISYVITTISYAVAILSYGIFESKNIYDKKIISEIKEGFIIIDDNNLLIDYNKAATYTFDWLTEGNKGKPINKFYKGKDIIKSGEDEFIISLIVNNVKKQYEFHTTNLNDDGKVFGKVYIFYDITEQLHMDRELKYLANYDWLTNIYNRRRIMEEAESYLVDALKTDSKLSILMIDIDHFKKVNDTYGHLAGDEVLRSLANNCKEILRKGDEMGRYGGEEFLILLPNTSANEAFTIAERIRRHIEATRVHYGEDIISVTISIGLTSTSINYKDNMYVSDLINIADKALYQAKNEGRNCVRIF